MRRMMMMMMMIVQKQMHGLELKWGMLKMLMKVLMRFDFEEVIAA